MFRIEFFVDDKKLGQALHALVDIAHGQPNVQPVSNVQKSGNGLVPIVKGGSNVELLVNQLKKAKLTQFKKREILPMLKTVGLKPSAASYMLKRLAEDGYVQKAGKGANTFWQVRS